jgi:cytochrome c2
MKTRAMVALGAGVALLVGCRAKTTETTPQATPSPAAASSPAPATASPAAKSRQELAAEGKRIFQFDTFGDEVLWTDTLKLNEVVEKKVDPTTALKVGLKVDADALPPDTLSKVDLKSPATTVALLKMNAVVGLQAKVDESNHIVRLGVTCALCHSTVDDSVKPGIGRRLDGWPNRDLNVGAIIALSPVLPADKKKVYASWGPGKYDPRYNQDGKNTPLVIPPAYGLAKVKNETYTAEGPISYWNAYVAITQMGGQGTFSDPRLGIEVKHSPDLVTAKLPALRAYQHSLAAPEAAAGSYDTASADRGRGLFEKNCASCHVGSSGTDNNDGTLHAPADTGVDGAYAMRTASKAYRTTPLRGLAHHPPYFHDGSAKTLPDVMKHYNRARSLRLSSQEQKDVVEYLKSL